MSCFDLCGLLKWKDDGNRRHNGVVPIYTFDELATATGYFSNENRLGEGGFGQVYKGVLSNQKVVAVKRLKHYSNPNKEEQARRQFDNEVKTISRIRHRNIVEVVGYCSHKADRLLVYEYVSNNSLKSHLDGNGMPTINWLTRMKIALGTAKGLAYLHEDCVPGIIHRDIKSDNILLNEKFEPKIGDFGLSKDFPESFSHVSTDPRGTHAYAPPEYYNKDGQERKLTDKSDVFSFGIVLLELITGKPAVFEVEPKKYIRLAVWVRPLFKQVLDVDQQDLHFENCNNLFDPKLQNKFNKNEMDRMIYCAAACTYKPVEFRPKMSQIVDVLKGTTALELQNIWVRNDSMYLDKELPYPSF